ncbi:hypothetical protein [Pseudothermotoga sp.]|uniref:hypothetical protein n=1 Tax=Pseudothermotoga sp. TaxID=2033661 RepID=UPI0031F6ED38
MKHTLVLLIISGYLFAAQLLINTFDMTGYLFEDGVHSKFKVYCPSDLSLIDKITDLYEPVKLTVRHIPMPDILLLISEKGFTVSAKIGNIVVPEEIFTKLFQIVKSGQTVDLIVDRYPVEIYTNRIKVLEPVRSEKIESFLNRFIEKFPKITGPGEYSLEVKPVSYQLLVCCFPGLGGTIMAIFEGEPCELTFATGGIKTKGFSMNLPPGNHTVRISMLGEATEITLNFPDRFVRLQTSQIELGANCEKQLYFISGIQRSNCFSYPGRFLGLEFSNDLIVHELLVRDTTPPKLTMNLKRLDSMCFVQLQAEDVSPFETFLYVDGEKFYFDRGVLTLSSLKHTLVGMAQDTFQNNSYIVQVLEKLEDTLVFPEEKVIDIGGFKFFSPYLRWQSFGATKVEVKINEKIVRLEKDR